MIHPPSSTQSINLRLQEFQSLVLKTTGNLAQVPGPASAAAIKDLKKMSTAIEELQYGISGHLEVGKRRLLALEKIGHAINSSLGLKQVLETVIDSLVALMQAERGFLMLRNAAGELNVAVARGIEKKDLEADEFAFSRTIVKRVAETGEAVLTTNAQKDPRFEMEQSVIFFHLRSILCVPLRLKGETIGVIFVDNRVQAGLFRDSDLDILIAFADQAAVAIDNARLFENLQSANQKLEAANEELEIAYEATLKGWVRALDLRDKETEGHTQRVTSLTCQLAASMGVGETDLVHISRGALLHDIGKMGIPDSILLKPGKLTDDERELMKRHTIFAYEFLEPIQFLRRAIDIPYCHHEKWNGGGYPRGLSGEDIPFFARVFSIVDVWDALTSDRPYHKAMPAKEARQYIQGEMGTSFDPRVVEAFLNLSLESARPNP